MEPSEIKAGKEAYAKELGIQYDANTVDNIITDEDAEYFISKTKEGARGAAGITADNPPLEPDGSGIGEPPAWNDPAGWEGHYYRKSDIDGGDWLKPGHPLNPVASKLLGDPVQNAEHPHHPIYREMRSELTKVQQRRAELESELEVARSALSNVMPVVQGIDNPEKKIYGGISLDAIRDGTDEDHDFVHWEDARDQYRMRESERRAKTERAERNEADFKLQDNYARLLFKTKHPDGDPDVLWKTFVLQIIPDPKNPERMIPNPDYKPVGYEDLHYLDRIRKVGGFEAFAKQIREGAFSEGQEATIAAVNRAGEVQPGLRAGEGRPPTRPVSGIDPMLKADGNLYTAQELAVMPYAELRRKTDEHNAMVRDGRIAGEIIG